MFNVFLLWCMSFPLRNCFDVCTRSQGLGSRNMLRTFHTSVWVGTLSYKRKNCNKTVSTRRGGRCFNRKNSGTLHIGSVERDITRDIKTCFPISSSEWNDFTLHIVSSLRPLECISLLAKPFKNRFSLHWKNVFALVLINSQTWPFLINKIFSTSAPCFDFNDDFTFHDLSSDLIFLILFNTC